MTPEYLLELLKKVDVSIPKASVHRRVPCPPVVDVETYLSLVQVAGLFKYKLEGKVLFRGQTEESPDVNPTAYRGALEECAAIDREIGPFLDLYRKRRGLSESLHQRHSTEPLLQHYGLRTRWLDVVDSLPHALFFALHACQPLDAATRLVRRTQGDGFVYVFHAPQLRPMQEGSDGTDVKGMFRFGKGGFLCDLREARLSQALRPHVQHGWLIRPEPGCTSLLPQVVCIIRFSVGRARRWIGSGEALSVTTLFPDESRDPTLYGLSRRSVTALFAKNPRFGGVVRFVR